MKTKIPALLMAVCTSLWAQNILLTGFSPFGIHEENISYLAIRDLEGEHVLGRKIHVIELPAAWKASKSLLLAAIEGVQPEAVISLGIDQRLSVPFVIEEYAFNRTQAMEDIEGMFPPVHGQVVPGAPLQLRCLADIEQIVKLLGHHGIEASVGEDPGGFICGWVYYLLLHHLPDIPVVFVHILPDAEISSIQELVLLITDMLLCTK